MHPIGRRVLASAAGIAAVGLLATGLAGPAAAATEPLPGTATSAFLSGWLPYWYGSSEVARITPHAGADGYVGEVMAFTVYSRYRTGGIQDPLCVHDGSDDKAIECARTAPTTSQANHLASLHAAGIKVLPSFTDDSSVGALGAVMADAAKRTALVNAQVAFVVGAGYDGVDLDYEDFAFSYAHSTWPATSAAWVAYITQLSAALHAQGKLLSVTVPAGYPVKGAGFNPSSGYTVYAWDTIIGLVDRLRIMTYDYSWDTPGAIGPANWVDEVASDAVEELGAANARKVWLGIAAYGYDWRTSSTCGSPSTSRKYTRYPATARQKAADALAAGRLIALPGQTTPAIAWDATTGEFWFRYREPDVDSITKKACTNTREVWFQDGASHVKRALIAAKYGLGGVAMWAFGDERDDTWTRLTSAAPQIKPYRPVLSLQAAAKVAYGQDGGFLAIVGRPGGTFVPDVPVTLQNRPVGSSTWTTIATMTTDATGAASFAAKPRRNGDWRITTPSAVGRQSAVSAARTVAVTSKISATARLYTKSGSTRVSTSTLAGVTASVNHGTTVMMVGNLSPIAGQKVALYRYSSGAWRYVSTTTSSAGGVYSFPLSTASVGTRKYQARSVASVSLASGRSSVLTFTVV